MFRDVAKVSDSVKLYSQQEWQAYRGEQIKLHGGICSHCLRSSDEVVLQVHHKFYVKGRAPWQYGYNDCEVLCRGCHGKEHGIVMPSCDWDYIGQDDLGDLSGQCDYCGNELRYTHMIAHPNWETIIVGAQCCDKLTGSTVASEGHALFLKHVRRRKSFVNSPKWRRYNDGTMSIRQLGVNIDIKPVDGRYFRIVLNGICGKVDHATMIDAQISAIDFITSDEGVAYLAKRKDVPRSGQEHDSTVRLMRSIFPEYHTPKP